MVTPTRGERLNNPGNIEKGSILWRGLIQPGVDPRFCQFDKPEDGIRALARNLYNYQHRDGLTSVREIVNRWAPSIENDTPAYVAHVCSVLNIGEDAPLDLDDSATLQGLTKAIILHEQGRCIYSDADLAQDVSEAYA